MEPFVDLLQVVAGTVPVELLLGKPLLQTSDRNDPVAEAS